MNNRPDAVILDVIPLVPEHCGFDASKRRNEISRFVLLAILRAPRHHLSTIENAERPKSIPNHELDLQ